MFDADVEIVAERDSVAGPAPAPLKSLPGLPASRIVTQKAASVERLAYHMSYADSAGHIVLDITAPQNAANTGQTAALWGRLRRIRFASSTASSEVTLQNGRVISGDIAALSATLGVTAQSNAAGRKREESSTERARRLQTLVTRFVRLRANSAVNAPAFAARTARDTSDAVTKTWSQANDDFDTLDAQTIRAPAGTRGRLTSITTTLAGARLVGQPSTLP